MGQFNEFPKNSKVFHYSKSFKDIFRVFKCKCAIFIEILETYLANAQVGKALKSSMGKD